MRRMKQLKNMQKRVRALIIVCFCILIMNKTGVLDVSAEELNAKELIENIRVGWNLGNTLECHDKAYSASISIDACETMWGNPKTTHAMIKQVKEAGFNAIRIPVTYRNHLDAVGTIDPKWLLRIEEVVQYGLKENMYVIINVHHDTGYGETKMIQANQENIEEYSGYVRLLWEQIASYFRDYDNRLIFEGMNEVLDMSAQNPWYGNEMSWETMNQLNQEFVNVVRATGGNNTKRNLIINTYGAQTTYGPINNFKMPEDTVKDHLIVGVHTFVIAQSEISQTMKNIYNQFVQQGYPVLVTEFGTAYWHGIVLRTTSAIHFMNYGNMYGIKCFWWDDGGDFKILNRKKQKWDYLTIVNGMMQAVALAE